LTLIIYSLKREITLHKNIKGLDKAGNGDRIGYPGKQQKTNKNY
jgi:hypothetical protein